jgi:hypothetical protein
VAVDLSQYIRPDAGQGRQPQQVQTLGGDLARGLLIAYNGATKFDAARRVFARNYGLSAPYDRGGIPSRDYVKAGLVAYGSLGWGSAALSSTDLVAPRPAIFTFTVDYQFLTTDSVATGYHSGWTQSASGVGFQIGQRYSTGTLFVGSGTTSIEWGVSQKDDLRHVVSITFDGFTLNLYRDGVLRGSAAASAPTYNFAYGYENLTTGGQRNTFALLHGRALSPAEIERLHADPYSVYVDPVIWAGAASSNPYPTLTAAGMTGITSTGGYPQVSYSF